MVGREKQDDALTALLPDVDVMEKPCFAGSTTTLSSNTSPPFLHHLLVCSCSGGQFTNTPTNCTQYVCVQICMHTNANRLVCSNANAYNTHMHIHTNRKYFVVLKSFSSVNQLDILKKVDSVCSIRIFI